MIFNGMDEIDQCNLVKKVGTGMTEIKREII
jgi:hypothetical protein